MNPSEMVAAFKISDLSSSDLELERLTA